MKNIIENNKLIAEFMGCGSQLHLVEHPLTGEYIDPIELNYSISWDWLMPVIEKIYEIPLNIGWCRVKYIIDSFYPMDINNTYPEVVEYIEWYNQSK